jgi:hypothetical protein
MYDGPSIFHVGYIKTATTFLQHRVFDREDLGIGWAGGHESRAFITENYIICDEYLFDPADIRAKMDALERDTRSRDIVPIWSEEMFLSDPAQPLYCGYAALDRLRQTHAGDIKVLITIREQRAFVLAAYQEFIRQGGRHSLYDYIGSGNEPRSYSPILRESLLHFDRAVAAYQQTFGKDNVLVLPIEMLRRDAPQYLHLLGDFLGRSIETVDTGVRVHGSLGMTAVGVQRLTNHFITHSPLNFFGSSRTARAFLKIARIVDKSVPHAVHRLWRKHAETMIERRYGGQLGATNRRLEALIDLDLKSYGYA